MTIIADPFAPLNVEQAITTAAAKGKAKVDKVPIVPVPDDAPECAFKIPSKGGAPTRMWAYRDRAGRLLGYDARFEFTDDSGNPDKDVLPVTYCQEADKKVWRAKALPSPRPLYHLDLLEQRSTAPVVIAEGCKSADAAGVLLPDHVAMSWQGGSNAIGQADWSCLRGRDVVIWPDRDRHTELTGAEKPYEDQPGSIAAQNIIAKVRTLAASVHILDLADFDCKDGWDADDALEDGWGPERAAQFVKERARVVDTEPAGTIMPYGFEYGADGLYYVESDNRRQFICGRIKLLAKTRDFRSGSWGLWLEWRDYDGAVHRWAMPQRMLSGDGNAIREELNEHGLTVSTEAKARSRLLQFLSSVNTDARARAVTQVGWSGEAFALPERTFGDTATERVIFQNPDVGKSHYDTAGTLEQWQEHVAKPAIGNSKLVFNIAAAFAGPILSLANQEGGGFNFVGKSSSGKTTGLRCASSVWGGKEYMRTWKATGNALESIAYAHSETVLTLDELGQLENRDAGPVSYMLANGAGKARANRTGGARNTVNFRVIYLSTGERTLADLIRESKVGGGVQAGQEVRVLDISADAGRGMGFFEDTHGAASPAHFANQLVADCLKYYGTASVAYLEALIKDRERIGDVVNATIIRFVEQFVEKGADGQVQRAARRFGLIAAAGELAIALGILPWPRDEAFNAAALQMKSWVSRRGGTGAAEDRNVIDRLRQFIQVHGDARFQPMLEPDEGFHRAIINRAGFYRTNTDGELPVREYLLLTEPFKEVFAGMDGDHVRKVLLAHGLVIPDKSGKSAQSIRVPGMSRQRCYVINSARLSGE